MTDTSDPKQNTGPWKRLTSLTRIKDPHLWWTNYTQMCSSYVDIRGKEWIAILLPSQLDVFESDSYMYDVEKDEIIPFIKDYVEGVDKKFMICHVERNNTSIANSLSYVIDNENHILHWLSQNSLISIDIRDFQNIKLINHTMLPSSIDNISFSNSKYKMIAAGNTIQFI